MSIKKLAVLLAPVLFCADLMAVRIQSPFYTLRERGQGGAIISASEDYSAVYFNPANMARLKESHTNMGFGGSFNSEFFEFQKDFSDAANEKNSVQKAIKFDQLTNDYEGETFALNPYMYGMYSGTKWGFAFIPFNTDFNITVNSDDIQIDSYLDGIMLLGFGKKYNEKIDWGVSGKMIYRGNFNATFDENSLQNDQLFDGDEAKFGLMIDMDAAMNYQLPEWKNIDSKLSLVIRNLLDREFDISADDIRPPKLGRRLDLGSQFTFKKLWVFTPKVLFDIRDIGVTDWDFQSGYHIGAELDWQTYDWLKGGYRIGLNQGYFTAGVNMQFAWFRLDLVSWGEEIGTKDTRKELRRVALNMSLDF